MQVILNNGTVLEVEKLPLGKYADLFGAIQELPKHLSDFQGIKSLSNDQFVQLIPQLLKSCLPDVIRIIQIATTLDENQINALGLDEAAEVIIAIYKVNNYEAVYEKIKKAMARPIQPIQNPPIPESLTPTS